MLLDRLYVVCIPIYIYVYVYTLCICVYIYVYFYISRGREHIIFVCIYIYYVCMHTQIEVWGCWGAVLSGPMLGLTCRSSG